MYYYDPHSSEEGVLLGVVCQKDHPIIDLRATNFTINVFHILRSGTSDIVDVTHFRPVGVKLLRERHIGDPVFADGLKPGRGHTNPAITETLYLDAGSEIDLLTPQQPEPTPLFNPTLSMLVEQGVGTYGINALCVLDPLEPGASPSAEDLWEGGSALTLRGHVFRRASAVAPDPKNSSSDDASHTLVYEGPAVIQADTAHRSVRSLQELYRHATGPSLAQRLTFIFNAKFTNSWVEGHKTHLYHIHHEGAVLLVDSLREPHQGQEDILQLLYAALPPPGSGLEPVMRSGYGTAHDVRHCLRAVFVPYGFRPAPDGADRMDTDGASAPGAGEPPLQLHGQLLGARIEPGFDGFEAAMAPSVARAAYGGRLAGMRGMGPRALAEEGKLAGSFTVSGGTITAYHDLHHQQNTAAPLSHGAHTDRGLAPAGPLHHPPLAGAGFSIRGTLLGVICPHDCIIEALQSNNYGVTTAFVLRQDGSGGAGGTSAGGSGGAGAGGRIAEVSATDAAFVVDLLQQGPHLGDAVVLSGLQYSAREPKPGASACFKWQDGCSSLDLLPEDQHKAPLLFQPTLSMLSEGYEPWGCNVLCVLDRREPPDPLPAEGGSGQEGPLFLNGIEVTGHVFARTPAACEQPCGRESAGLVWEGRAKFEVSPQCRSDRALLHTLHQASRASLCERLAFVFRANHQYLGTEDLKLRVYSIDHDGALLSVDPRSPLLPDLFAALPPPADSTTPAVDALLPPPAGPTMPPAGEAGLRPNVCQDPTLHPSPRTHRAVFVPDAFGPSSPDDETEVLHGILLSTELEPPYDGIRAAMDPSVAQAAYGGLLAGMRGMGPRALAEEGKLAGSFTVTGGTITAASNTLFCGPPAADHLAAEHQPDA
ncbi:hypothetical protein HYH03_018814 [Edaphochlamys debaryana]|uniref:Uncharacterized protein n=1 Tax=Edaphochlamys debaryana TaxID=47281 RepID=A0A835XEK2_9CHLO|nr:hypothetical protein HYH03_018814 [Edaphochlamys debaryana]|eukprot:KAG2482251.1 hypothetical protein HYH03_018814 [Edaphochlamys debaryana]